jgi:hypothetical protein
MSTVESISMNSSRPYDHQVKAEKSNSFLKELLNEKEERIKDLTDKSERMEKDFLKLQIQLKNVEEKLKLKMEKDYIVKK